MTAGKDMTAGHLRLLSEEDFQLYEKNVVLGIYRLRWP